MDLFKAQNLSRYLVFIVNNVQRRHVFCYFRDDDASSSGISIRIAGGVFGALIVFGIVIAVIVYIVKKNNTNTVNP